MENINKNCSLPDHKELTAISYCQECKIYMCNKCEKIHSGLCLNHHKFNLDKNLKEIFTGFCLEEKHSNILEYFCKNHNVLCCAACISKIKGKGNGQHTDCDVCCIEDIKEEKKNKLQDNIKLLEELSNSLLNSINQLKIIFEKIKDNKESIKINIQNIFTKIRNEVNKREDELLLEVDNFYINTFFKEELIKEGEKMPNEIKASLEKGKEINKEWREDSKLNLLINDCIRIENNINKIKDINSKVKIYNKDIFNIKFSPKEEKINDFLKTIKTFGKVYMNNIFHFKKCPINIVDNRKYTVSGENDNILTKTGAEGYMGTICDYELDKFKEHKWKIKILKSKANFIDVGVAPIDFDINSASENSCGWYLACDNSKLYSGPPHRYNGIKTDLSKVENEIVVVMNMNKGTLKFLINGEDRGDSYTNIPLDRPLSPAVLLKDTNDSVEISALTI